MPSNCRILTEDQVEQFLTRGYIVMRDCFSRDAAEQWTSGAWARLGYDPADPSTWVQPRIHIPNVNRVKMEEFAPKAWAAACELLGGEERVQSPCWMSDGFIMNFGVGADQPWEAPSAAAVWNQVRRKPEQKQEVLPAPSPSPAPVSARWNFAVRTIPATAAARPESV